MVKFHLAVEDDPCPGAYLGATSACGPRKSSKHSGEGGSHGAVQIGLCAGQTVFWTATTIHRGVAPEGVTERWNLTGSLVRHEDDRDELDGRFAWRLSDYIRDGLPEEILPLYDNWRWSVGG